MAVNASGERAPLLARVLSTGVGSLVVLLVVMWTVEIVDTVALDSSLQQNGIQPREIDGLDGILWAPFLHGTIAHLASNSIPLLGLGFLVALHDMRYWLIVTAAVLIGGGALTWLFAASGNHIGASGIVFGYFGALVGAAIYDR